MGDTVETIEHFHIWFGAGLGLSLGVLFLVMFLKAVQHYCCYRWICMPVFGLHGFHFAILGLGTT